jgi:tetratricopeptide (TPR) repeat protein
MGSCHLPEVFGREYIRFDDNSPEATAKPPANELPIPSKEDQLKHEQQLSEMELSDGPYAAGLTDPLINLAFYYKARGDFESSLENYRRALHLVRVNDGLSSDRQIPILREMMEIYRSAGDYEALGDLYHYYYRVRKLGQAPLTQDSLDASLEYFAWERDLYAARSDGLERNHLLRAYRANQRMLSALVPTTEQEVSWYIRLSLSQLRTLYMVLGDDLLSGESRSGSASGTMAAEKVNREVAFIQKMAYHKGKKLLAGCIEYARSSSPVDLASLHLEMGDWLQWNGGLIKAREYYARVEQGLRAAGEEQLLLRWLGQPMELPDEQDLWPDYYDNSEPGPAVVEARYDVTASGDARKIKVSVTEEEESWQAWRIKRMLRDTHFRPRFSDGKPQAVEQVSRRYRLLDVH